MHRIAPANLHNANPQEVTQWSEPDTQKEASHISGKGIWLMHGHNVFVQVLNHNCIWLCFSYAAGALSNSLFLTQAHQRGREIFEEDFSNLSTFI